MLGVVRVGLAQDLGASLDHRVGSAQDNVGRRQKARNLFDNATDSNDTQSR